MNDVRLAQRSLRSWCGVGVRDRLDEQIHFSVGGSAFQPDRRASRAWPTDRRSERLPDGIIAGLPAAD